MSEKRELNYSMVNKDVAWKKWRRCIHPSDTCLCNRKKTSFNEKCQTCGEKATFCMPFASGLLLFACDSHVTVQSVF